jgi:hypothetical protein
MGTTEIHWLDYAARSASVALPEVKLFDGAALVIKMEKINKAVGLRAQRAVPSSGPDS